MRKGPVKSLRLKAGQTNSGRTLLEEIKSSRKKVQFLEKFPGLHAHNIF